MSTFMFPVYPARQRGISETTARLLPIGNVVPVVSDDPAPRAG
jgi:hypothetical protein